MTPPSLQITLFNAACLALACLSSDKPEQKKPDSNKQNLASEEGDEKLMITL
jgi:hypothetical protein